MSMYVHIKKTSLSFSLFRRKQKKPVKTSTQKLRCEKRRIMTIIEKKWKTCEKKATMSEKFRGHCRQNLFQPFSAPCPRCLNRVCDCPRSGIKRKTEKVPGRNMWEGTRGRGEKVRGKEEEIVNRRSKNRKEERGTGDPETLWGHCRPVSF